MKQVQITRHGGPEVFRVVEESSPPLPKGCVRIQVGAAGVNFADIMMRAGMYPEAPKPPFVPGYEVAGKVIEVGADVAEFKVGDRVLAGTKFGGYTSECIAAASSVRRIPGNLTDIEAAAIPVNWLTAWIALHEMGRVRAGDRVLIQSAAGGVGTAAVQIATRAGAHVVGLVGSVAKMGAVKSLGAREILTNDEWERGDDVKFGGFDIILDATGGTSLKRSIRRLAPMGRVVNFGVSAMVAGDRRSIFRSLRVLSQTPLLTPFKLMMENKGVFGLNLLQLFEPQHQARITRCLDAILKEFEAEHFKVVVGKTFPLAEAGAAHQHLQGRGNVGKVVLVP